MEKWKDVVGAEEHYQVSNLGRIRNKHTYAILKPSENKNYKTVDLRYGINKTCLVHRLVAIAFIPNPNNFTQVNHKDENKKNNNAENLEWCTPQYNVNYGKGALARNQRVIQYDLDGNAIKIWESIKEASESLQIKQQGISRCCRNLRRSTGGYAWTYANISNVKLRWKNKRKESISHD